MSVLIKGMKMPTNCWFCSVKLWDDFGFGYVCPFSGRIVKSGDANRHEDCPLIELPDHGDLIDRDELDRFAFTVARDKLPNCYNGYSDTYDKAYIIGILEELPNIDPVRHGKWEYQETWAVFKCSACDASAVRKYPYCPNCGAKMDGGEE